METPVETSGVFGRFGQYRKLEELNAGCGYERHGGGMGFWVFLTPGFEAEEIRSTKIPEYHNSFFSATLVYVFFSVWEGVLNIKKQKGLQVGEVVAHLNMNMR